MILTENQKPQKKKISEFEHTAAIKTIQNETQKKDWKLK